MYKYGAPERLDVLRNALIRYTQPAALNDPFELRPFFDSLIPESDFLEGIRRMDLAPHLIEAYNKLPEELRQRTSLEASVEASKAVLETDEGQRVFRATIVGVLGELGALVPWIRDQLADGLGKRIGILSVSSVPDNILMWAHYALRHTGIAIGLDERHKYFDRRRSPKDDLYQLRPVKYRHPQPNASMRELDGRDLLVRKDPVWSYEQEWRILAPVADAVKTVENNEDPIYLFPLPSECVTEVILGARSSDVLRDSLFEIVGTDPRYHHVRIRKAILDTARGVLDIQEVEH